ncbi:MAG: CHAD domain-containing protein [Hyphomicrobiaceae bacterium]
MAYRFKPGEPFEKGARRIVRQQADRILALFASSPDPNVAIHQSRRCLKRLRALTRLLAPALGTDWRRHEARWRDLMRELSEARDHRARLDALLRLEQRFGTDAFTGEGARLREALIGSLDMAVPTAGRPAAEPLAQRIGLAMRAMRRRLREPVGLPLVAAGYRDAYRRARRGLGPAFATAGDEEAFHDWRKAVQVHWRHTLLLARAWPEHAAARASGLATLSELIGDDRDLCLLEHFLAQRSDDVDLAPEFRRRIGELIATRHEEMRAAARPIGERLFADRPKCVEESIAVIWRSGETLASLGQAGAKTADLGPAHADR